MKSVKKYLRQGIYEALNGVISVPVHDKLMLVEESEAVCIGNIQATPDNVGETFRTKAIIDLEITHHQHNAFTHDRVDEIEGEILEVLIPSVDKAGFSVSGFQVVNVERLSSGYIDEFNEKNTARTILKIQSLIIQQ